MSSDAGDAKNKLDRATMTFPARNGKREPLAGRAIHRTVHW